MYRQDYRQSLNHFKKSLDLVGVEKLNAIIMFYIGRAYCYLGKFHDAILYLERAGAEDKSDRNNPLKSDIMGTMALCYTYIGRHDKAKALYEHSIPLARSINHKPTLATQLVDRGYLGYVTGHYEEALVFYDQALDHALDEKCIYINAMVQKATILIKMKKHSKYLDIIRHVRPMVEGDERLTTRLNAISHLMDLNNPEAIKYLEDVAIPYFSASDCGFDKFVALDLLKELEAFYIRKKSKLKALTVSHLIRGIHEGMFWG